MDGFYIHHKELERLGITKDSFFRNVGIIKSIFDEKWLAKQEYKFNKHPFAKRSMEPLLNRHPVYRATHSTTIEDMLYLYNLGECFSSLSNIKGINTYIPRLKTENEIKSAFFELLVGKTLLEKGFTISGLQINNNLGNPVELLVEKSGYQFWIECKSTYVKQFQDDLLERIIISANEVMKGKNRRILFKMIIESEVEDIFYTNKKFLKDFKYAITKAYERDENGFPISFNDNGDVSGIKWRLECHLFENLKEETVNSFILNECDKGCAFSKAKKSSSNSGMPDLSSPPQYSAVFGVKYLFSNYSRKDQIRVSKICDQIKEKIKQQENLLSSGEMVIIILDEDIIEKHDIAIIRSALSLNIKNLGIFIASKINNPFQFNLNPVYIGDNLIEKFEVK